MPRDATGTYTLPLAPFVAGTLAKAGEVNSNLSDIAQALTDSQSRSTPSPALGDVNMNGHDILNLGQVQGDLVASGGVFANGLSSNFGFEFATPHYVWHWGVTGYDDTFDPATGTRTWATPSGSSMLSAGGVLTVAGSISTPALSVSGAASVSGTLTAGGLSIGSFSATSATISGALTAGSVTTPTATVSGTLTAGGLVVGTVSASVNVNVGVDLVVGRNALITGGLTAAGATISGTLTAAAANINGALNASGTIAGAGLIQGGTMQAYRASGLGGFVGSYSGSAGSNVGMWNNNGLIYWGNADGAGTPNSFLERMHLDTNSNLVVNNAIYAIHEVHAGDRGVYYTGLDSDAHAIGFLWTGTKLDIYVDKFRVGSVTLGTREGGAEEAPEMTALEARLVALEARVAALGG